jgi:hypothetical protein
VKNKILKKKATLETIADSIVRLDVKLSKKIDGSIANLDKSLSEKIDQKIDELAIFTANGFKDIEERLSNKIGGVEINLNAKIDGVEENLNTRISRVEKNLSAQIVGLDNKIDDLNFHKVRDEVYVLTQRVVKVETKVGIKT